VDGGEPLSRLSRETRERIASSSESGGGWRRGEGKKEGGLILVVKYFIRGIYSFSVSMLCFEKEGGDTH
jgi:hypothetical protein